MDNINESVNIQEVAEPVQTEPVQSESVEVAEPQQEQKHVQSAEDNARFAEIRRKTESETRDKMISEMYGDQGIHTYADYQKALAEQKAEEERQKFQQEHGINPDDLKPVFEQWKQNDPDFKELSSIRAEKNIQTALTDLNNELKDAGVDLQLKDLSDSEVNKIPNVDKVTNLIKTRGLSLAEAFFLANKKDIISKQTQATEQETIKKLVANGQSSPGSLAATGDNKVTNDIWNMSKDDFKSFQEKALRGELKKS